MTKAGWTQDSLWAVFWNPGVCLCPSQLDRGYGAQGTKQLFPTCVVCGALTSFSEEETAMKHGISLELLRCQVDVLSG